jgi:hypothetical protein
MLAPMHHAGSAGALAEVLGANRHGTNRAVELMKRIGSAARGISAAAASDAPALPTLHVANPLPAASIKSRHGPPRVSDLLPPAGRAAVVGFEADFDQRAFDTFARDHRSLVGSLTKDQPYASLAFADRATLAWERVSARSRTAFAEEFLAHWLASEATTAAEPAATGAA